MNMERRLTRNGSQPHTTQVAGVSRRPIGGLSISLCTLVVGGLIIYLIIRK